MRAVRARVRRTAAGRLGWRIGVGVVGGLLLVAGVVMIPGPGQGWATVFLALAVLSTEFAWAQRVRHRLWARVLEAQQRYQRQSRLARAALTVLLVVLVGAILLSVLWGSLSITDLPGWLPNTASDVLTRLPGVD